MFCLPVGFSNIADVNHWISVFQGQNLILNMNDHGYVVSTSITPELKYYVFFYLI